MPGKPRDIDHPADRCIRRQLSLSQGFTLVELLVVLAIVGLLTALVAPRVVQYLGKAKTDTAQIQVDRLAGVLDLYRLDVGRYPSEEEGLLSLAERPESVDVWNGPYLRNQNSIVDPWGNPYVYRFPGEHSDYDLYSLGADGKEGGEGDGSDIRNW